MSYTPWKNRPWKPKGSGWENCLRLNSERRCIKNHEHRPLTLGIQRRRKYDSRIFGVGIGMLDGNWFSRQTDRSTTPGGAVHSPL